MTSSPLTACGAEWPGAPKLPPSARPQPAAAAVRWPHWPREAPEAGLASLARRPRQARRQLLARHHTARLAGIRPQVLLDIAVYTFVIKFFLTELYEACYIRYRYGTWAPYFLNIWNVLEVCNIIPFFASITLRLLFIMSPQNLNFNVFSQQKRPPELTGPPKRGRGRALPGHVGGGRRGCGRMRE